MPNFVQNGNTRISGLSSNRAPRFVPVLSVFPLHQEMCGCSRWCCGSLVCRFLGGGVLAEDDLLDPAGLVSSPDYRESSKDSCHLSENIPDKSHSELSRLVEGRLSRGYSLGGSITLGVPGPGVPGAALPVGL
jgi:hypothetical protein